MLAISSWKMSLACLRLIFMVGVNTTPTSNSLLIKAKLDLTFSSELKFDSLARRARSLSIAYRTSGCSILAACDVPERLLWSQNLTSSSGSGKMIATMWFLIESP